MMLRVVAFAVWTGIFLGLAFFSQPTEGAERPPNVVVILSDDQAWTDYGFMGHPQIKTPHLDRLAKESLVFTRGYVPTSLCRPSLMTLITGLYAHQHLITGNDPPKGTDRREMLKHVRRVPTLPKLLAPQGYASFQSGKWWEGAPAEGGFTAGMTHGDPARGGRHGDVGLEIGRKTMQPVLDFIDANQERPFFLWYAPMLPHSPHNPPERLLAKYKPLTDSIHVARYWAMCELWDETCGQLLDHLSKRKLDENTLVVYVTDNGWIQDPASPKYAPRSKRSPHEGGVRTPIMLRWPAKIAHKRDETSLVSSIDLAPTMLAACGVSPPAGLPGLNLLEVASGKQAPHAELFGEIFEHDIPNLDEAAPGLMFRWCIDGGYKLIVPKNGAAIELYDLAADPHETKNLAAAEPARVKALLAKVDGWWKP